MCPGQGYATVSIMSSLDHLLETNPADLVSNLKELRAERAELESKELLLEQLIDLLARQAGPTADHLAELGGAAAIGPLRSQITHVLHSFQGDGLFFVIPQAVHDELINRGNTRVKLDNVRQTMARMTDAKELERPKADTLLFGLPGARDDMPQQLRDQIVGDQST
jgi:hypothetical protein